jgi:hypothetical protein
MFKTPTIARQQWFMPVILATWRQRSGRLWFKASLETLFPKYPTYKRANRVA